MCGGSVRHARAVRAGVSERERGGQRLLEWELERYSRHSAELKARLMAYSREPSKASLAHVRRILCLRTASA